jgi:hypothetical protein
MGMAKYTFPANKIVNGKFAIKLESTYYDFTDNDKKFLIANVYTKDEAVAQVVRTLTYDANGGTFPTGSTTTGTCNAASATASCNVAISNLTPNAPNGKAFLGWSESSNATEPGYVSGQTIALDSDKTIYAVYATNHNYTLTYDANGGTFSSSATTTDSCTTTDTYCERTISDLKPTPPNGKKFLGWSETASATEPGYFAGDTIRLSSNKTIYAIYSTGNVTWIQDQSHAISSGVSPKVKIDFPLAMFIDLKIDGSVVDTANYTTEAGSTIITINTSYADTLSAGSHTLVASFKNSLTASTNLTIMTGGSDETTFTLTYDANGGTFPSGSTTIETCVTTGTECTVTISSLTPEYEDHEFIGWATTNNAETAEYKEGDELTLSANKTIYAVYLDNSIRWIQEQKHSNDSGDNLIVRIGYPTQMLISVEIDDEALDEEYYTVSSESGGTVIAIKATYANTLSLGSHRLLAEFEGDRFIVTTFSIEDANEPAPVDDPPAPDPGHTLPDTGFFTKLGDGATPITSSIIATVIIMIGATTVILRIRSRKSKLAGTIDFINKNN